MIKRFGPLLCAILLCCFSFGTTSCSHEEESKKNGETYRLAVFETSDIHGYLADTSSEDYQFRLAFIADKVNDARIAMKNSVLLADAGDIYQGNALSNLLDGIPLSAAYAAMGYDAVTAGNHEFDWGIEYTVDPDGTMMDYSLGVEERVNRIPVVLSNLYLHGERVSFTRDYVILEKTAVSASGDTIPIKIGVIGFAEDYSTSIMHSRFTGVGYSLVQDYDKLERMAAELERTGQCDATILLTHSDAASISGMLSSGTAFDLILGGHSHENQCGETDWGLAYMEPTNQGRAYAYAELIFQINEAGKPMFLQTDAVQIVPVIQTPALLVHSEKNSRELDETVAAITEDAIRQIRGILTERIGYIAVSACKTQYTSSSRVIYRESTCGNWMASLYARAVGADIGFVNDGGIREAFMVEDGKASRDITVSDIYAMFPFNNRIFCYEITYEELLTLLRYSLTYAGGTLFSIVTGIDLYYSGYSVEELVMDGKTIYADGEWMIDPTGKVKVAANEYSSTTARMSDKDTGSLSNPLREWLDTDRLISDDQVDVEAALRLLREEAAENRGLLSFDQKSHYIERQAEPNRDPQSGPERDQS